jgi:pyruvate dehydrogenase E1 component alpha subunit
MEATMPRSDVAVTDSLESLSILDEHGNLDRELEPQLSETQLHDLYRAMLLGRRFDERMLDLQRQGRIGTFPPIKGQEASQMGAVFPLRPGDWFVPAFRETAAEIWRGRSLESIILYYNGFNEGALLPETQKDLPIAIPVGSQVLHAVGLGWAARYRRTDEIVMVFFGDGATSQGDFHEGLNFAAVYQLPVVFVCQNNQWAISVPVSRQTHTPTLAQKAHAYGMPGIRVDGNDVLAVYAAAVEAAERARSGGGPTLIECVTYRLMMHTTADDPKRYRSDEEVALWQQRDPLPRFAAYLQQKGTVTEPQLAEIETRVMEEIQAAVDAAEQRMQELDDPLAMFDHLYAERPPHLEAQKSALARELADAGKEVHDE